MNFGDLGVFVELQNLGFQWTMEMSGFLRNLETLGFQ